jgi:CBS domain-containing protein
LRDDELIGVLEQLDILSYFANHSHLVAVQIQKAQSLEELKSASEGITKAIKVLFAKSVRTTYIAKMVSELNSKLYKRVFEFILPHELWDKCALIVMGSEGRDEQILKTDQDNALIIKDGVAKEQFYPYMQKFTDTLIDFGYPKCDGKIMVSNPYWCKSQSEFKSQIETWFSGTEMEYYMHLAIFFDAKFIAGDEELLMPLKEMIFDMAKDRDVFMAYFAKATLAFETPIGIFSNLVAKDDKIDIKKGGIFSIVQGVRALSLENRVNERTSVKRIKALHQKGLLDREFASELIEAFGLLSRLRLQAHIQKQKEGKKIDNLVDIKTLGKIERDMLKDSFLIVNKLKKFISHHFRLSNIS